jgi:hypothetical protein
MELPLVQLTKLSASPTAVCPAGNWDEYRLGAADNSTSLPVDYALLGYLLVPPRVGHEVQIIRVSRNGVPVFGVFISTVVQQLIEEGFVTENSVYRLEYP